MFMCDVTKTPPYARNFVYSELLFICKPANGDVSIRFNGKDDNVVLEYRVIALISVNIVPRWDIEGRDLALYFIPF